MSTLFDVDTGKTAVISPCGLYRYRLTRAVGAEGGSVNFVMLNPSVADAIMDDNTIRRCQGFVRDWGHAELVVTNLFALRSTDPKALRTAADPVGPENDHYILEAARAASVVICAWGAHGAFKNRGINVIRMLTAAGVDLCCLAWTKDGQPGHPLYLPRDAERIVFTKGRPQD